GLWTGGTWRLIFDPLPLKPLHHGQSLRPPRRPVPIPSRQRSRHPERGPRQRAKLALPGAPPRRASIHLPQIPQSQLVPAASRPLQRTRATRAAGRIQRPNPGPRAKPVRASRPNQPLRLTRLMVGTARQPPTLLLPRAPLQIPTLALTRELALLRG